MSDATLVQELEQQWVQGTGVRLVLLLAIQLEWMLAPEWVPMLGLVSVHE
jgi:hypothetical protein